MASTRARAHAPWSASKVQTALRCPREFYYRYVERAPEPEVMPEARVGKAVHAALEDALQGGPIEDAVSRARPALEDDAERDRFDALAASIPAFVARVEGFRRRRRVGRELLEHQLAIRADLGAAAFFAPDAFYRGVFDAAYLYDGDQLAIVDHKTGARSPRADIVEQLQGYAVLAAAHVRAARRVWLGVHWVASASVEWAPPLSHGEVGRTLAPRLMDNIEAAALAVEDGPRPTPSEWCLRCSYRSVCPEGRQARLEPVEDDEPEIEP